MAPDLSVIIVSWNVQQLLRCCLKSVYDSIKDLTFEIFVVDNASSDGSVEMIQSEFEKVELIANRENGGFGKANNQALKRCRGRYVLFLNPDTLVPEGSIEDLVRFLTHHPTVGMVGPELPDGRSRLRFNWSRLSLRGVAEFVIESLVSMLSQTHSIILFDQPRAVRWLTGACWLVRKKAIDSAGPFDENLFLYGEEPDFCYRLRRAGWEIYFRRSVCITHFKGQSVKQTGKVIPRFLKSIIYVVRKIAQDRWGSRPLLRSLESSR